MGEILIPRRTKVEEGYKLLADITVGTATTSVDITGLNIGKGDEVVLVSYINNSSGDMFLYVNNNTTNSNYWCQAIAASAASIYVYRYNAPYMRMTAQPFFHNTKIKLTNSGYFVVQHESTEMASPSTVRFDNTYDTSTFTISSITSLKITATQTIGIGSRFQLYKIN